MSNRFAGRTAIVTRASRAIGLAIAERLVADGAKVVTTRKQEALDAEVERRYRDMKVLTIGGGTCQILAGLAAKRLGYTT